MKITIDWKMQGMEWSPKLVYLAKNTDGKRKALRSMNCGPTIEKHR